MAKLKPLNPFRETDVRKGAEAVWCAGGGLQGVYEGCMGGVEGAWGAGSGGGAAEARHGAEVLMWLMCAGGG
jgi:hypothetical protein